MTDQERAHAIYAAADALNEHVRAAIRSNLAVDLDLVTDHRWAGGDGYPAQDVRRVDVRVTRLLTRIPRPELGPTITYEK